MFLSFSMRRIAVFMCIPHYTIILSKSQDRALDKEKKLWYNNDTWELRLP